MLRYVFAATAALFLLTACPSSEQPTADQEMGAATDQPGASAGQAQPPAARPFSGEPPDSVVHNMYAGETWTVYDRDIPNHFDIGDKFMLIVAGGSGNVFLKPIAMGKPDWAPHIGNSILLEQKVKSGKPYLCKQGLALGDHTHTLSFRIESSDPDKLVINQRHDTEGYDCDSIPIHGGWAHAEP